MEARLAQTSPFWPMEEYPAPLLGEDSAVDDASPLLRVFREKAEAVSGGVRSHTATDRIPYQKSGAGLTEINPAPLLYLPYP